MSVLTLKGWGALPCRILLYTPLDSTFTGESLTILDFVRGTLLQNLENSGFIRGILLIFVIEVLITFA